MKILFVLISLLIASVAMAIEEPKFTLLEKSEPFELRTYAPLIVAEVKVSGDVDSASNQGFRLIAGYIFGKNQVSEKISMTAPVAIEASAEDKSSNSKKIEMTVPVTIEESKSDKAIVKEWTVSFVMPSEYTLASLPKPLNPLVQIRAIPAEKKAVITFSGFYGKEKVQEKTQSLEAWIALKGWKPISEPQFARYNPPWSLPFMRRNEIMITVRD